MLLGHLDIFGTVLDETETDEGRRQQCGQQHQKHQAGADVHPDCLWSVVVSRVFHGITLGFSCEGQLKSGNRSGDMVHNEPSFPCITCFMLKRGLTAASSI